MCPRIWPPNHGWKAARYPEWSVKELYTVDGYETSQMSANGATVPVGYAQVGGFHNPPVRFSLRYLSWTRRYMAVLQVFRLRSPAQRYTNMCPFLRG